MSDRREARLLLTILDERWDEAERLAAERGLDRTRVVALAAACDVAPYVHAVLVRSGRAELLGPEARAALEARRGQVRRDNMLLLARVEEALDLLLAEGIRPVALKGVDLLHRLYARIDERTLDDVDLLVGRADRDRALEALERAGWSGPSGAERTHWLRSSFEMPLTSPGPIPVNFDLHWSLGQTRRYEIPTETLVARAVPLSVGGRGVLRLDDHDAVAHLLIHHVQHYFDRRLKWVLELLVLGSAPGFDWKTVAERLRAWGGAGAAGLALGHVEKLFPNRLPATARAAIPADAWRLAFTLPLRSSHPLDYFRGTRSRPIQLWIAAAALASPLDLPGYLRHRATRDRRADAE